MYPGLLLSTPETLDTDGFAVMLTKRDLGPRLQRGLSREQLDCLAGNFFSVRWIVVHFFIKFEIREEDRDYTAFVVPL
jgi:hypothetical protein